MDRLRLLRTIAFGAALFGPYSAHSATIQISATSLALRTAANSNDLVGEATVGLLQNPAGHYFASVPFSDDGQSVCRFTMIYRENDVDHDISASLQKKPFKVNSNKTFDPPITLASVSSNGASDNTRRASTKQIKQALLDLTNGFYFVELDVPQGANAEIFGLQIDVEPTCP